MPLTAGGQDTKRQAVAHIVRGVTRAHLVDTREGHGRGLTERGGSGSKTGKQDRADARPRLRGTSIWEDWTPSGRGNPHESLKRVYVLWSRHRCSKSTSWPRRESCVPAGIARRRVELFVRLHLVEIGLRDVLGAIDLHRLHELSSFWDALVVRSAQEAGCTVVLFTEDLDTGGRSTACRSGIQSGETSACHPSAPARLASKAVAADP